MPVKDDSLVAQYIRALENPDSLGYRNGIWTDAGVFDSRNRGFGVDVENNIAAARLAKNRPGKWITEEEERNIRLSHIGDNQTTLDKWTPKMLREAPSEEKEAMALGMLYRGDGIKSIIKNPTLRDTYYSGSAEDMQRAVSDFYEKKLPERANNHNKFFSSKSQKTEVPALIRKKEPWTPAKFEDYQFKSKSKYSEGGYMDNLWDSLSMKEKSEMMKVAIANGITSLPEIRQAYNKFAKGGRMNGWTMQDEAGYRAWRQNLPRNLRETDDNIYDMRAAYKAGMQPEWSEEDKSYHLGSRDPESGRILKSPHHSTFLKALIEDASMGYYPTMDSKGNIYTETWEGNKHAEGGNLYRKGGRKGVAVNSNSQRAMGYLLSRGMSRTGASAIVGTLQAESNLDPTIHARMKGDNGEGIAQWTGSRKKNFWKTLETIEPGAQKRYGSIDRVPLERQLDVVLAERPDVTNAIHSAKDISTATDIMLRGYENGGGTVKTMASKGQMDSIYGKWNNGYNNQIKKRLGNANVLLGSHIDPASYELPQGFFADIDSQIQVPAMQFPTPSDIDPSTIYQPPTIDATLFANPKPVKEEVPIYNPQQERLEGLRNFNTVMGLMGQQSPFAALGNGSAGLLDYISQIYS